MSHLKGELYRKGLDLRGNRKHEDTYHLFIKQGLLQHSVKIGSFLDHTTISYYNTYKSSP